MIKGSGERVVLIVGGCGRFWSIKQSTEFNALRDELIEIAIDEFEIPTTNGMQWWERMPLADKWHAIESNQEAALMREFQQDIVDFCFAVWPADYTCYRTLEEFRLQRYVRIGGDPTIDSRPQFVKEWHADYDSKQEQEDETVAMTVWPKFPVAGDEMVQFSDDASGDDV